MAVVATQGELQLVLERCLLLTWIRASFLCSTYLESPSAYIPNLGTVGSDWGSNWGSSIRGEVLKSLNLYIPESTLPSNAHFLLLKTTANSFRFLEETIRAHSCEKWVLLFSIPRVLNFYTVHLSHTVYFLIPLATTLAFLHLSTLLLYQVPSHFWIFPVNNNNS